MIRQAHNQRSPVCCTAALHPSTACTQLRLRQAIHATTGYSAGADHAVYGFIAWQSLCWRGNLNCMHTTEARAVHTPLLAAPPEPYMQYVAALNGCCCAGPAPQLHAHG